MKISFDLDGTYTEYSETFDDLAFMLQAAGHEVGILSARPAPEDDDDAILLGFDPDFEWYLGLGDEYTSAEKCSEKYVIMQEEEIDMHYDDEADLFPDSANVIKIV